MLALAKLDDRLQVLLGTFKKGATSLSIFYHKAQINYSLSFVSNPVPAYVFPQGVDKYPLAENTPVTVIATNDVVELIISIDMVIAHRMGYNLEDTKLWWETYTKLRKKYARLNNARKQNSTSTNSGS